MADPKGDKLFVNLGASQTRRRLKGFGHGVRKVQSAGNNQSVIIHTATGMHLAELEAKFADVGFSSNERSLSEPVANLLNLGPTSTGWLRDVGIRTRADLIDIGPALAWRLVKRRHPAATIDLLWSLAAGLAGRDLTDDEKTDLRRQVEEL